MPQLDITQLVGQTFDLDKQEVIHLILIAVLFTPYPAEEEIRLAKCKMQDPDPVEDENMAKRIRLMNSMPFLSPSTLSHAPTFDRMVADTNAFDINRLLRADSIPVSLIHLVFAHFEDTFASIISTPVDDECAKNLQAIMCMIHTDEKAHALNIRNCLKPYLTVSLEASIVPVAWANYTTDSHFLQGPYTLTILEVKNELNSGAAKADLQVNVYYLNFTRSLKWKDMIGLVHFLGIAFHTPRICSDVLVQTVSVHSETDMDRLLHALGAYRQAVHSLVYYYKIEVPDIHCSCLIPDITYPYPDTCHDEDGNVVQVKYTGTITRGRSLFTGTTVEGNRPTMIKSSCRYSVDVHRLCAKHNCMTSIIGSTLLPSSWIMIVVELITDPWVNIADAYNTLPTLRQDDLIHSDLRDTNIFMNMRTMSIKVVDFEWAGKKGKVKYSAFLNVSSVHRPKDVEGHKLIKHEHDEEMIRYIVDHAESLTPD